ncbi:DUF872 domain-containing protein [Chloropicon primus]|uniref:Transmembrane protein 230 n=1 Tax=Chloropicon primus TaxID=1764295 RepID=A0A5B8MPE2_9CHLO|nr:hypothetical protein A3770_07p48150 [Chloropicon primus]UPR01513.1 DUF872 domain-containing protein [Chloropicon primus]|eukprot:QDZ22297.1 hypothetical protein A3770_07p48150 [Chloropicon primus]
MATKRSNAYAKLKTETSEENEEDLYDAFKNFPPLKPAERDPRFESQLIKRTPWREIVLAVFLLMMGTSMYVVALLCHYGHIHPKRVSKGGFFGLGTLVFMPGFYMTRIAYYTWRGHKGYSFDYIPHQ